MEYGGPSSYRVVWQFGTADQYTVWNVDDLGDNHTTNPLIMLGKAYALEGLETTFQQDLNGDGTTGFVSTVIEAAGSMALIKAADGFIVNGSTLQYNFKVVTEGMLATGSRSGWSF